MAMAEKRPIGDEDAVASASGKKRHCPGLQSCANAEDKYCDWRVGRTVEISTFASASFGLFVVIFVSFFPRHKAYCVNYTDIPILSLNLNRILRYYKPQPHSYISTIEVYSCFEKFCKDNGLDPRRSDGTR